jgi:peptidoglycan/xylan/chitin deacetylase (PgdA/CDA1 family)
LSVDTEEEWDWNAGFPVSHYSVRNSRNLAKFQSFCENLGVRPTYFVNYAVASDPDSVRCLKAPYDKGSCEIGAHLHSWVTPPLEENVNEEHSHAINLPLELVRRKLRALTQQLTREFGASPLAFRSGRWGVNGALLRLLIDEGYQTDSSIHPFHADSRFSYHSASTIPYWPDLTDCLRKGTQRSMFEIPVTAGFNRPDFARANRIHRFLERAPWRSFHLIGVLWHLRMLRKLRLSPELAGVEDMLLLINACLARGHRMLHMYLHSSSLLPGGSPYVSNAAEEQRLYNRIAGVISALGRETTIRFCTLTEANKHYLEEEHA